MFVVVDGLGNVTSYNQTSQQLQNEIFIQDNDAIIPQIIADLSNVKYLNGSFSYIPRTTPYQAWNGSAWVTDATVLQQARDTVWEKIKDYRTLRQLLGVKVLINGTYYWIHSDTPSRELHQGLRADAICHLARTRLMWLEFPAFVDIQWKTMQKQANGQPLFVTVNYQTALDIYTADKALTQACFAKAEYHRVYMEASADPLNYNYTTGWPVVYGEE